MSMDRLVELFLESARPEGEAAAGLPPFGGGAPDEEAVERGVAVVEKMLSSEDAIRMGGSPSATFVCLGMAMEEKPMLSVASIRCYEKALEYLARRHGDRGGGWERCVVLQQMAAVGLRQARYDAARRWLDEVAELCRVAPGHPRDADLFSGAFNTQQTRMEFAATIEKMRAQVSVKLGDNTQAYAHIAEAQRLEKIASGDAVERHMAHAAGGGVEAQPSPGAPSGAAAAETPKDLWAATPAEVRQLKQYSYMDEGPTVTILLELNEHLGLGEEASEVVQSLQQFRVQCEGDSLEVQLRLRRKAGDVCHFRLLLAPLVREIVPEDTVPRLRGKPGKRRLEVKLFKREKTITWYGDIVSDSAPKRKTPEKGKPAAPPAAEKGSLLNPLTAEELARLPKPSGGSGDNRPSAYQHETPAPTAAEVFAPSSRAREPARPSWPEWVASVDEDGERIAVTFGDAAGASVDLCDLDLAADAAAGVIRLRLLVPSAAGAEDPLELRPPAGADVERMLPKWRRKARTLELRFPAA